MTNAANPQLAILKGWSPETFSRQLSYADAKPLEDLGLIRWVGHLYGTNQYALTDKGRAALEAMQ